MWEFLKRTAGFRSLHPMARGSAEAAAVSSAAAAIGFAATRFFELRPSAHACSDLATIGAALLIAYAVETAWIVEAANRRSTGPPDVDDVKREERVGRLLTLAAAGLLGIALALLLSDRAGGGSWSAIDEALFGAACSSLLLLGVTVVMQPLAVHEWSRTPPVHRDF